MQNSKLPTRKELEALVSQPHDPAISIYLPTHRRGAETRQDCIRLKNLLSSARSDLLERGLKEREIDGLLAEPLKLLDDNTFWKHQQDGLAFLIAPGMTKMFMVPVEMPELLMIGEQFHIVPLLPVLERSDKFYVLTLAEDEIKLYNADRYQMQEVPIEFGPTSMAQALFADDPEKQLQWHTRAGRSPQGGGRSAMFHGTGDGTGMEDHKVNLKRYFDIVANGLAKIFDDRQPVFLAGVDYLLPIYREADQTANLMPAEIHGNWQHRPAEELHKEAWSRMEELYEEGEKLTVERLQEREAKGVATCHLNEILDAASNGRVDTLLISAQDRIGVSDSDEQINKAAIATLLASGQVCTVQAHRLLNGASAAAIFRY